MVIVNGNMVPPLGSQDPKAGGRSIRFEKVIDQAGKPVELKPESDWRLSTDADGKQPYGEMKRGWRKYVSVKRGGEPNTAGYCKVTVFFHLSFTGKGCSATDVNTTMEILSRGAKKLGGHCPCDAPPNGYVADNTQGRTVEVVLVFHPKSSGRVAAMELNCGDKPPKHGKADSNSATMKLDGNLALTEGPRVKAMAALAAHEMGHLLFGTGSHAVPNWRTIKNEDGEGHNHNPQDPKAPGLMRDTRKRELVAEDEASPEEICKLLELAGSANEDCCTYKKIPQQAPPKKEDDVIVPPRRLSGSAPVRPIPGVLSVSPLATEWL